MPRIWMQRMYLLSNRPSWSVAHSAVTSFNINLNLIGIWEFIQAKSHTVAQCVANHLRRGPVYQSTIEKFMLKKLGMWGFDTESSISQLVILNRFMKEKSK
jgi:hypothetical protein